MTNWTKDNIPDLNGKVFIITDANSGLGYECTLALAEKGGTVIMACRSLERAQHSLDAIRQAVPSASLESMELDLASLKSVCAFAESFKNKYDRLDVLINNGSPIIAERSITEDGFESHFGVNHLGHFALTGLLLGILLKTPSSRVVTVGSREHVNGKIQWDDLMSERSYDWTTAYRQSKLANMLFAFELSRGLGAMGSSTLSVAAHPGLARTGWVENNLSGFIKVLGKIKSLISYQRASLTALPVLYAAVDPNAKSGSYYGPEHDTKGYPVEVQASEAAYNETDAERLWELSEKLTGVKYEEVIEEIKWEEYYQKKKGHAPRQLLLDVLEKYPTGDSLHAIDLGSGDGTETVVLLSRGWKVLAVDGTEAAIKHLMNKVPQDAQVRLQTRVARFEEITLPQTDLIHASLSIPFCYPSQFPALWEKITNALNPGGRFAGQFFGVRDSWANEPDMTFHTEKQVRQMLDGLEIEYFYEQDEDGEATSGPKHWHVFTVIARKV